MQFCTIFALYRWILPNIVASAMVVNGMKTRDRTEYNIYRNDLALN